MRLKFAAVLPAFLLAVPAVLAQTESAEFTVGDIRIEGLQRITEGTVYNYLPVNIGDRLNNRRVDEALRVLSTYVQRMRTKSSAPERPRTVH